MTEQQTTPQRAQSYSLASLLLLMAFLGAGMALLRSGVANGVATKNHVLIVVLIVCGQLLGAGIGLVVGLLGPNRRLGIPVSMLGGAIVGGFSGGVFAVNVWFPLFPIVALVLCVVAACFSLTRRRSDGPPPPPSGAMGGSPPSAPPQDQA